MSTHRTGTNRILTDADIEELADEAAWSEMPRRMLRAVAVANARIARCHTVVACPKCRAPVGVLCQRMPRGYVTTARCSVPLDPTKHPHRERWTLVQPDR